MQEITQFLISNWQLSVPGLLFLIAFIALSFNETSFNNNSLSSLDATLFMNRKHAQVIDLRPETEFKAGHILNANRYDFSALKNDLGKLAKSKDKPLLIYCKQGQLSAGAVKFLQKQGFNEVKCLRGGFVQWQKDNLPVTKN